MGQHHSSCLCLQLFVLQPNSVDNRFPSSTNGQLPVPRAGGASFWRVIGHGRHATAATHIQHHAQTRMRTRHTLIKKLTRGKLLFLGLDGAGKSTIIHHLIRSLDEERTNIQSTSTVGDAMGGGGDDHRGSRVYPNPLKTHQSWSYRLEGDCYLQVLDVPGRREFRRKWYTTALAPSNSTSALYSSVPGSGGGSSQTLPLLGIVFVVDASSRVRFPIVAEELIRSQKLKEQKRHYCSRSRNFDRFAKQPRVAKAGKRRRSARCNVTRTTRAEEVRRPPAARRPEAQSTRLSAFIIIFASDSFRQLFVVNTRTGDSAWCATGYQVAESANRWYKSSHSDCGGERSANNGDDDVDHGVQRARPREHQSHPRVDQGGDQESDVAAPRTNTFISMHEP